jgi:hypothetical protein
MHYTMREENGKLGPLHTRRSQCMHITQISSVTYATSLTSWHERPSKAGFVRPRETFHAAEICIRGVVAHDVSKTQREKRGTPWGAKSSKKGTSDVHCDLSAVMMQPLSFCLRNRVPRSN